MSEDTINAWPLPDPVAIKVKRLDAERTNLLTQLGELTERYEMQRVELLNRLMALNNNQHTLLSAAADAAGLDTTTARWVLTRPDYALLKQTTKQ